MKYFIEIFCIILVNFNYSTGKKLPSFVQKCKRTDPELRKCLIQRIEDIKPHLIKGIPEMKLPPIEPLHIPKLEIQTGNEASNGFKAVFTDISIYGVKDFQVKDFNVDFQNRDIYFHFYFPYTQAHAKYSLNGKILLFELKSNGLGHFNITDIDAKAQRKFTIQAKNGKEYIYLADDYSYDIKHGKVNVYFENLFKDNQQLTEQTNKAVNENFAEISNEIDPLIYEALIVLFSRVMQDLCDEYAIEELYD